MMMMMISRFGQFGLWALVSVRCIHYTLTMCVFTHPSVIKESGHPRLGMSRLLNNGGWNEGGYNAACHPRM
jgi:hypothetical protein